MKLMGIALILIGCTVSGFVIDGWEKRRIKELENFIYLFEILKRDIAYHLTPLGEACTSVSKFGVAGVREVFRDFEMQLKDKTLFDTNTMWLEALHGQTKKMCLKEDDYTILQSFGKACGYLDQEMQEKNIEMVIEALKGNVKILKKRYEKTTKINKYLGFFIGACISIFLI